MAAVPESRPALLVFHKLTTGLTFGVSNYSPKRFEFLLNHLTDSGWHLAPAKGDLDSHTAGRGEVAVSFDDGYEHLIERLPALMERFELTPTIFVPSALIGCTNNWDYNHIARSFRHLGANQITQLAGRGVIFGSHGASHCDLTRCDRGELLRELSDSRKRLQDLTGQPVASVSYPFGRCDRRVCEAANEAGYRQGYTMAFPALTDSNMARGRIPVYGFDTPLSVALKLRGGTWSRLERIKAGVVTRLSGGTVWLNGLRGGANRR